MKLKLLFTSIVFFLFIGFVSGQERKSKIEKLREELELKGTAKRKRVIDTSSTFIPKTDGIETTIITINLSSPDKNSITHSGGKKRLVVSNKNPLAIKLINGNPLKYDYKLTYNKIDIFGTDNFSIVKPEESSQTEQLVSETLIGDVDEEKFKEDLEEAETVIYELSESVNEFITLKESQDILNFDKFKLQRLYFTEVIKPLKKDLLNLEQSQGLLKNSADYDKRMLDLFEVLVKLDKKIQLLYTISSPSYLLPIDLNGDNIDYVEIQLTRQEKGKSSKTPELYTYKIWLQGGLKIDVSGGGFITSLFDKEYRTTQNADGTMSTISEIDNGEYDFGFGALVNISPRGGTWIRPTFNFGTILTSNQKFQIVTGAGIILGKNERWLIHGGLTMGQVNELDDNFLADGATPYDLGSDNTVPTTDKFGFGHFFGITYNFSKPKSNEVN
ncbi:hypothetical protein [Dokdonia sp. Hel_I_53]|uniref:hypothetical protein n=1 Tax=Dokdonia sp. Hel_I_53 TaxID=1566287 RepID=UPI00119C0E39|nr:hypothetical protein [Dokdonia sp. Hel_I_53]TVZ51526.1 hypothetical protein OD90_0670 [Dokdonia sp. Hel_I_53]